ncbi:MAG TPA: HAMP domain-containing sensor histidine kinase [Solirubrobacterales bacterium]|nr:HAMP domain-containing sensor histidine kinase [Solirubrobacterales bacterium]
MSLRRRLALLSALAVALAVVLASVLVYALVRSSLRGQIDDELEQQAARVTERVGTLDSGPAAGQGGEAVPAPGAAGPAPPGDVFSLPPPGPGAPAPVGQLILRDGEVVTPPDSEFRIPVSAADEELAAAGGEGERFEDVEAGGESVRVLTAALPDGGAVQVARSLEETEQTLSDLVVILFLVSGGGIALAAALGPVVARTALAPAGEVSDAAEEVARTRDLTRRIEVRGDDELGRLAASFNEMMEALELSDAAQRRLVADASHELRTPLATLRTNIETLGRAEELDPAERDRLVADLTAELEELTELVSGVVELARAPGTDRLAFQDVRLDELAASELERARRRARELRFSEDLSPVLVSGDPQRLGRAISNLLDNAAKWSPPGGEVELEVAEGRVAVRDHGPGFTAEDLPRVFDRFWRADEARGRPGSGLGLAIVQRIAEEHGGRATAANAEGGGALVAIELPPPREHY